MAAEASVKIEGLERAIKKLAPSLYGKPVERFLNRVGIAVTKKQTEYAATKSARMKTSLGMGEEGNVWQPLGKPATGLRIGTNVKHKGFSYPRALDESAKYHYARGPRKGQQTMGWFSKGVERAKDEIDKSLETLKREIAERWGS